MTHDFLERLEFSEGVDLGDAILEHLRNSIPGSIAVEKTTKQEDKQGTDYWIKRLDLPPISVDVKHRSFDPIEKFGSDDACIETTSVYVGPPEPPWLNKFRKKPGWTIDSTKRTDLVVYTWPTDNGKRRFWIVYFPHLCSVAQRHWSTWAAKYGEKSARNDGYLTLSVYPPRAEIAKTIQEIIEGRILEHNQNAKQHPVEFLEIKWEPMGQGQMLT